MKPDQGCVRLEVMNGPATDCGCNSLLFLHHEGEYEAHRLEFLMPKLERAFRSGLEELR